MASTNETKEVKSDPEIKLDWQEMLINKVKAGHEMRDIMWVWSTNDIDVKSFVEKLDESIDKEIYVSNWVETTLKHRYEDQAAVILEIPIKKKITSKMINILTELSDGGMWHTMSHRPRLKYFQAVPIVFAHVSPPHDRLPKRFIDVKI